MRAKMRAVPAVIRKAKATATRKGAERNISGIGIEHEPRAANVDDQGRPTGDVDLPAQIADVNVHDVRLRHEAVAPDPFEQHGAGHELARTAQKELQELEFARQK